MKNKQVNRIVILWIALVCMYNVNANPVQENLPEVGKSCPDFLLSDVTHYKKSKVTLKDFKGKWLFLEFWYTGCSACIWNLKKVSDLQAEFSEQATFLLVGYNGGKVGSNIREVYEKLRVTQGLNTISAYDSVLVKQWKVTVMPHIVIVDPDGIVRGIAGGADLTKEKISNLLNGGNPSFYGDDKTSHPDFNPELQYSAMALTKERILHHSLTTTWNNEKFNPGYEMSVYGAMPDHSWDKNGIRLVGVSLEWLYSLAWLGKSNGLFKFWGEPLYGKVYPFPVLEISNTKAFENRPGLEGLYNYNLWVPSSRRKSKVEIMQFMQQDLERTFGYTALVEERDMPVWKLIAKPEAIRKIKTKGGDRFYTGKDGTSIVAGFTVRNIPMSEYIMYLCFYLNEKERHPFIDDTGITSNIDLTINADLTNLEEVRKELQKSGLDLVQGTRKMTVLVIKDIVRY